MATNARLTRVCLADPALTAPRATPHRKARAAEPSVAGFVEPRRPSIRRIHVPSKVLPICSVAFTLAVSGLALAQSPMETGTGGDVTSTTRARNTTAVGQTKPPGAAAGGEVSRDADRRTPQQKKDNEISKGICIGCN